MFLNESFNQHRVISHFETLLEYNIPIKSSNNYLNLDKLDQKMFQFYLSVYLVSQFISCLFLFILNNWHYLFRKKEAHLKRTQSVIDFEKKNNYERYKLAYLETHILKKQMDQVELNSITLSEARSESNENEIHKTNSYLYVPYFKTSKLNNSLSDLAINI